MKELNTNEIQEVNGGLVCGGLCVGAVVVGSIGVGMAIAYFTRK